MSIDGVSVAGTAIGGASLLIQVFQGCVYGFSKWQKAENVGVDAVAFQARLEMQGAKLKEWGVNWEINDPSKGIYMRDERFKKYGDVAVHYLGVINLLLEKLTKSSFEVKSLAAGVNLPISAATHIARLDELANSISPGRTALDRTTGVIDREATFSGKLKWDHDEEKATNALKLVKSMIDELYHFLEPPRSDVAAHVVFNASLTSARSVDAPQLNDISEKWVDDPLLQGLANLKRANLKLEERATALDDVPVLKKWKLLTDVTPADARNNRSFGKFDGEGVLVEWKRIDLQVSTTQPQFLLDILQDRVKNIARLLKVDFKPPDLRTLPCLGVVSKTNESDTAVDLGLLFKAPDKGFKTLYDILSHNEPEILLGDRFHIARTVGRALLFLHLAGWLHKGMRSHNIVFFGPESSKVKLDEPYIVGFEYSRQSGLDHHTQSVSDDLEFNFYRHPDVQGLPAEPNQRSVPEVQPLQRPAFNKRYDLYGFGVILLELGTMQRAIEIYNSARSDPSYGSHSATTFSTWLTEKEVPKLGSMMGRSYREVSLAKNFVDDIPPYAILSHTWGEDNDEVTFDDLENGRSGRKAAYAKVQFCGKQAEKDGLE